MIINKNGDIEYIISYNGRISSNSVGAGLFTENGEYSVYEKFGWLSLGCI